MLSASHLLTSRKSLIGRLICTFYELKSNILSFRSNCKSSEVENRAHELCNRVKFNNNRLTLAFLICGDFVQFSVSRK